MILPSIIEQHYADLRPLRFIELSEQIRQLYDGPWVQIGNYPEEGANNPNPTDQAKARQMWRRAYKMLQPYEKLIYEDYQTISHDSLGVYAYHERQAITAMWKLCEAYHNVVELWDQLQRCDDRPLEDEEWDYQWRADDRPNAIHVPDPDIYHTMNPIIECKFFKYELRTNMAASMKFLKVMMDIEPSINSKNGSRRDKIKWPHIKEALNRSLLIDVGINPTDFGYAISSILPNRSASSVKQSFKTGRINEDFPNATDQNTITDIMNRLNPVLQLLKFSPDEC